ncbi:MAG TPA: DUF4623 domain-containing protein [Bacteroidales bacterium]|nr:DUF4623 domain-containing protein [Bacteroidales bacterium]
MKKNRFVNWMVMLLIAAITVVGCKKDDPKPDPKEAKITSFAITNAGQAGNQRVEGVIENLNILVVVPFETNLTALVTDIKLSEGAQVVPASGTPQNFTEPRNFVVTNGTESNTYRVTVEKAAPTSGVISSISFKSYSSGEIYPSEINQAEKRITVTINVLQNVKAVINQISLMPAGATYTTSGQGDTLDLSSAKTITVAFAGTTTVYNVVPNIIQAGFDPTKTTVLLDRSGKSGLVPSIINNENTRGMAFDGRYAYAASRKDGNFLYVWDMNTPTADPATMPLTDVVSGGTWLLSDVRVVDGRIFLSNMVMNPEQVFKVYKWNSRDATAPELVLSYTLPASGIRLGDAISVIGNPPQDGYIFASNFAWPNNASEFYVWSFNAGQVSGPTVLPITPTVALRMGQYGRVSPVPGEPDKLLVTGAEMGVAVIKFDGTFLYESSEPMIQSRSYDFRVWEYNGGLYLSYVVNREWEGSTAEDKGIYYDIINITEGTGIVQKLSSLNNNNIAQKRVFRHNFGAAAAVWVGATHQVGFGADGKPRAMSFGLNNGFIIHQFSN